jgi:peroxiredoxin
MKSNKHVFFPLIFCTTLFLSPKVLFALEINQPMPAANVKMKNVDGKEIALEELPGKSGKLVIFSCNHCPFARAWEERIVEIGNLYQSKGIGVAVINSNDPTDIPEDSYEKMQFRAKAKGYQFPYLVDATSNVARQFGASKTPEAYLFDGNGKLVYQGAIDDNKSDAKKVTKPFLKNALEALVSGKSVVPNEAKAIGCSIKFRKTK